MEYSALITASILRAEEKVLMLLDKACKDLQGQGAVAVIRLSLMKIHTSLCIYIYIYMLSEWIRQSIDPRGPVFLFFFLSLSDPSFFFPLPFRCAHYPSKQIAPLYQFLPPPFV